MAKILGVAAHDGNALAVAAVLRELYGRGVDVMMLLQEGLSAAVHYNQGGPLVDQLDAFPVFIEEPSDKVAELVQGFDAVVTAMSPVPRNNLEITVLLESVRNDVPVYGVEEVVGGRNNPGWRDYVFELNRLFAAMPEEEFRACPESVVGSSALERWRNVSVVDLNVSARAKLGIGDEPVIYFFPAPERESPTALHILGSSLASVIEEFETYGVSKPVLILNRHRRELSSPVPLNGSGYRSGLKYISEVVGLKVFDNSPEYFGLPTADERSIVSEFMPPQFLNYQEMLAVTANTGLAITFFGTDGLMVAPYLANQGILSVLWLDPTLGGRVLQREKQVSRYNLPEVLEVYGGAEALAHIWRIYLIEDERDFLQKSLVELYSFPPQSASVLTAEHILQDLKK